MPLIEGEALTVDVAANLPVGEGFILIGEQMKRSVVELEVEQDGFGGVGSLRLAVDKFGLVWIGGVSLRRGE